MFVEGGRDGPVDVDALDCPLMALGDAFGECGYAESEFFLKVLFLLASEELIEFEVVVGVAERIVLDVFEELRVDLIAVAELEEVLDAVEALVVVEHEEVLALLLLRHIPQPLQRVERSHSLFLPIQGLSPHQR